MVVQVRAEATRQRIIEVAIELFAERGYAETGLKDITKRADLTTGALYYHFESKELLVESIIEEGWNRAWDAFTSRLTVSDAGLENVIAATIAMTNLYLNDRLVWIASQLNQAFGHLSPRSRISLDRRFQTFLDTAAAAIPAADIRDDITPQEVAELIWIFIQGSSQLPTSGADPIARAMSNWGLLLRAIVPTESLPYFKEFLARNAGQRDTA